MDNSILKSGTILDKTAVTLSGLCLLHCLAFPLVLVVLPFLSEIPVDHLHAQMLILVIPISVFAFVSGYRRHRNFRVVVSGAVGMVVLAIGGTVAHYRYGLTADRVLTIAGALILAVTHYFNSRLSRHRPMCNRPALPDDDR